MMAKKFKILGLIFLTFLLVDYSELSSCVSKLFFVFRNRFNFQQDETLRVVRKEVQREKGRKIIAVIDWLREQGTEVWVDTADPGLVERAAQLGATWGTSNPALVTKAIKEHPEIWIPIIIDLKREGKTSEEIARIITGEIIREDVRYLPGGMSWEVDPRNWNNADAMYQEAKYIYEKLSEELGIDNNKLLIKIPCTKAGLEAVRRLANEGLKIANVTLVFTVAQAIAAAEAGAKVISPFLGRWDDRVEKVLAPKQGIELSALLDENGKPVVGLVIAQKMHQVLKERGYEARLVMASIRHTGHMIGLVGADILTVPPHIIEQFADFDINNLTRTIDEAFSEEVMKEFRQFGELRDAIWVPESIEMIDVSSFDTLPLELQGNQKFIIPFEELLRLVSKSEEELLKLIEEGTNPN